MKNKFTPYEKLSKKEKKKVNTTKRSSWGYISPVTKVVSNKKAYNRNKFKKFDF